MSAIAEIAPSQDLHGYDHPWPGGGGKNLYDPDANTWEQGGYASTTGRPSGANVDYRIRLVEAVEVTPGETYTISSNLPYLYLHFYDSKGVFVESSTGWQETPITFIAPADCYQLKLSAANTSATPTSGNEISPSDFEWLQLEKGSVATVFAPYENYCPISGWTGVEAVVSPTQDAQDGNTYSVNWETEAGTVYDGEIELVSGELTDKARIYTFNGTENIEASSDIVRFYFNLPGAVANSTRGVNSVGFCSHYAVLTNVTSAMLNDSDMAITYSNTSISSKQGRLAIMDSRFSDAASYKAWLAEQYAAGAPVQLVYLRDEDATYQLTPTRIPTLIGENNIWVNTGDITVTIPNRIMQ